MKSNLLVMGLVLFILIGYGLAFYEKEKYNLAPKIIWTYWDNPDKIPKTVKMCIKGWEKSNPDYKIILLTKKNFKGYVTIPMRIQSHPNFHDNPTRFADLVRVWTLAEHGGVWVDSSTIIKTSLKDWLFPKYAEFSGFYIESTTQLENSPMIENWFFACNKGSPFMKLWRDEFSKVADYPHVEQYVASRKQMGVNFEKIKKPLYLTMHVSAQKILQIDKYPLDSLILRKAEDGPFRYLKDTNWESERALNLACVDRTYQAPIMKIRGAERKVLEEKIEDELSPQKCGWLD